MIYIYILKFFFIFIPSLTLNATEKITDLLVADHEIEIILFEYLMQAQLVVNYLHQKPKMKKLLRQLTQTILSLRISLSNQLHQ